MSVKRGREAADYRYMTGVGKNSSNFFAPLRAPWLNFWTKDDVLLKQVQLNNKLSQAVNVYGRNREKFSQIDRNRYNLHKKPSSRNRKFLEEDKPSKIKLTRNVKKDLGGYAPLLTLKTHTQ